MIAALTKKYLVTGVIGYLLASVPMAVSAETVLVSFEGGTESAGWGDAFQGFSMSSTSQQGLSSVSLELANGSPDGDVVYLELYAFARGATYCLPEFEGLIATSAAVEITNTEFEWVDFLFADLPELIPDRTYYVALRDDAFDGGDQLIRFDTNESGSRGGTGGDCGKLNHRVRVAEKEVSDFTISNIQFSPPSPAQLRIVKTGSSERVEISFEYSSNREDGVLIFVEPYEKGMRATGSFSSGSPVYPAGTGSGTSYFGFRKKASIDQIYIGFWINSGPSSGPLKEILIPVEYEFTDHPLRDARDRAADALANLLQSIDGQTESDSALKRDAGRSGAQAAIEASQSAVAVPVLNVPGLALLVVLTLGLAVHRLSMIRRPCHR